jgi:hypothetical protein
MAIVTLVMWAAAGAGGREIWRAGQSALIIRQTAAARAWVGAVLDYGHGVTRRRAVDQWVIDEPMTSGVMSPSITN